MPNVETRAAQERKRHSEQAGRTYLPNNPQSIKKFQEYHKLDPDGIIGPITRKKMRDTNTTLGLPKPVRKTGRMPYLSPAKKAGRTIYGHDELH